MGSRTTTAMLARLEGVDKTYGEGPAAVHALRGVDLDVAAGELVVVLGPSGSGKTTLLNVLGGIERPTAGKVLVGGRDLAGLDERALTAYRRSVGFVFQFFNLIPTLTAFENVELIAGLVRRGDGAAAGDALAAVGLAERANHFPGALSGGEQQRVAIARALVKQPDLLLCDEPTGSLDLATGREVLAVLRALTGTGRSVVLVTHNNAIAGIADRVVTMGSGRISGVSSVAAPLAPAEVEW